jgi:hypothetical protein
LDDARGGVRHNAGEPFTFVSPQSAHLLPSMWVTGLDAGVG